MDTFDIPSSFFLHELFDFGYHILSYSLFFSGQGRKDTDLCVRPCPLNARTIPNT